MKFPEYYKHLWEDNYVKIQARVNVEPIENEAGQKQTAEYIFQFKKPELSIQARILGLVVFILGNSLNLLPDDKFYSLLKEFADDNFKFDENGRKLSKQVENTVGKGEIALYERFLLFLQCFQKVSFPGASKGVIVWEWVKKPELSIQARILGLVAFNLGDLLNPFPNKPWVLHVCTISLLKTLWEKEKLVITSNFSFSPMFSTLLDNFRLFSSSLKLSSANSFSLEESKICK